MEFYEREFFISKISAGYTTYEIDDSTILNIFPPTQEQNYNSQQVYMNAHREAELMGVLLEEELLNMMKVRELWTEEDESSIERLPKDIEEFKVEMYRSAFTSGKRDTVRKYLKVAEEEFARLTQKRHCYDYVSCAGYATYVRWNWIIENCTKLCDGTPYNWEEVDIPNVLTYYQSNLLSDKDIRYISKTEPWRTIWATCKKSNQIFSRSGMDLTNEQRTLILWSSMYDNAMESHECPPDDILNDDDMLDGWMILQKRNRDKSTNEALFNKSTPAGSKNANADEVFVVAETQEDIDRVNSLNDMHGQQIKKQRLAEVAAAGQINYLEFSDMKRDVQMKATRQFSQSMKGR